MVAQTNHRAQRQKWAPEFSQGEVSENGREAPIDAPAQCQPAFDGGSPFESLHQPRSRVMTSRDRHAPCVAG